MDMMQEINADVDETIRRVNKDAKHFVLTEVRDDRQSQGVKRNFTLLFWFIIDSVEGFLL